MMHKEYDFSSKSDYSRELFALVNLLNDDEEARIIKDSSGVHLSIVSKSKAVDFDDQMEILDGILKEDAEALAELAK